MKLRTRQNDELIFELTERERSCLVNVLGLYPLTPPAHYQLSRNQCVPEPEEAQKLLDEAMAEQRAGHRKALDEFLNSSTRFSKAGRKVLFTLSDPEADFLLQVLNDIRVGSWISIGSPVELPPIPTPGNIRGISIMEIAGFFEGNILAALTSG